MRPLSLVDRVLERQFFEMSGPIVARELLDRQYAGRSQQQNRCVAPGCMKMAVYVKPHPLCRMHWGRFTRNGSFDRLIGQGAAAARHCEIGDCKRPARYTTPKIACRAHYMRYRATGHYGSSEIRPPPRQFQRQEAA